MNSRKSQLLFEAGSSLSNHVKELDKYYMFFEIHVIISNIVGGVSHKQYRSCFVNEYKYNDNYETLGSIGVGVKYEESTNTLVISSSGTIYTNNGNHSSYRIYGIY